MGVAADLIEAGIKEKCISTFTNIQNLINVDLERSASPKKLSVVFPEVNSW